MAAGTNTTDVRILHAMVEPGSHPDFAALASRTLSPARVGLWADEEVREGERPEAFVDESPQSQPDQCDQAQPDQASVPGVRVTHAAECRRLTPEAAGWQLSGAFVVLGIWKVRPGTGELFASVVVPNAEASVRDEPGCVFFQVLADRADPDRFFLLEGFRSRDDFAAHAKTPHFAAFAEVARPLFAGDRSFTIQGAIHPAASAG